MRVLTTGLVVIGLLLVCTQSSITPCLALDVVKSVYGDIPLEIVDKTSGKFTILEVFIGPGLSSSSFEMYLTVKNISWSTEGCIILLVKSYGHDGVVLDSRDIVIGSGKLDKGESMKLDSFFAGFSVGSISKIKITIKSWLD